MLFRAPTHNRFPQSQVTNQKS
ncbi:hypothetical protein Prudu_006390 [Prunus dulcis]|uniref:Uncharacterized protein n=1 Tax=Prunus dulcis TaxID=3755 RepID=A0A4Y1QZL6_PRUDU|nr:hypothetical protein Prudu_006390 [Prunus dulcis]